jgi:hypothetical protein|tara:strand:+ start:579 stop:1223 length:645 start_codon:yes stop_codon:yes gene_type:complete
MSFTYTTLKQAIQDWTENDETTFVNNLDVFIKNTEERILKLVDLDFFRKNVSGATTSSNKFLAMPADYLASFSLSITKSNNKEFLLLKDVNFIQEFNPNESTTGTPRYYAPFDVSNFILAPTPDAAYVAELHYYYRPQSITATSDGTSWLGTNAPDALLYGCLSEANTFMKGEADLSQQYQGRFTEAINRLKNYGEGVENSDAYREGLVRIQKS